MIYFTDSGDKSVCIELASEEQDEQVAVIIEDVPDGRSRKESNTYAAKKTVAQGKQIKYVVYN